MRVNFGIDLPTYGEFADPRLLASLAREAEDAGWDGFFLYDQVAPERPLPLVDPWIALTAVALATTRLRLGTLVTPLPRRRPWKLARETVSLDHLSGGRLILGVGLGVSPEEFDDLGEEADLRTRAAMLDEALIVLTGLWSGEPFSHQGTHYTVRAAQFLPPPAAVAADPDLGGRHLAAARSDPPRRPLGRGLPALQGRRGPGRPDAARSAAGDARLHPGRAPRRGRYTFRGGPAGCDSGRGPRGGRGDRGALPPRPG